MLSLRFAALALVALTAAGCTSPAPVTPVAPAPIVVATPAQPSSAVAMLQAAWAKLPAANRATVRESWALAGGDPDLERVFAALFAEQLSETYPVTTAEALEFLHWMEAQS